MVPMRPTAKYDYHLSPDKQTGASQKARHDLYLTNQLSGRIICQLETITPTVTGNEHNKHNTNKKSPVTIKPYRWKKKLAISANSLRGMLSNTAETLSQSSLRILEKDYWPVFRSVNTDLLPWHTDRTELTPAEMMFGVVEDNKQDLGNTRNLASRIKFYDALPVSTVQRDSTSLEESALEPEAPLNELAEPAPRSKDGPSNNFNLDDGTFNNYFLSSDKTYLTHQEIRNQLEADRSQDEANHSGLYPRGRKFYLLHQKNGNDFIYTGNNFDRKMYCTPIKPETLFYFHIDFENLTHAEFTLLVRSIEPKHGAEFCHRIGLGKPLGLGVVQLKICHIFLRNYTQRFASLSASKYSNHKSWHSDKSLERWKELGQRYCLEIEAASKLANEQLELSHDNSLIDESSLHLLLQTGSYDYLDSELRIRWRKKEESGAPLPLMSIRNNKLPNISPDTSTSNQPPTQSSDHSLNRATNYIQAKGEAETEEINWIRSQILGDSKKPFDDLQEIEIIKGLTSKNLANNWLELPEIEPAQIAFKNAIWQLILTSVEARGYGGYWNSAKKAKKIYDEWSASQSKKD